MCRLMSIIEDNFRGLVSDKGLENMKRVVCSEVCNGVCKNEYIIHNIKFNKEIENENVVRNLGGRK